ncbi:type I polyketide synthase [Paenibacillus riograndensis]|uniref:Uncharacterized protein n=4 Tax=Paenibacillus riograndensis TaxID=483937 RepID=A0A0E4CVH3_9BACL|nr:type I polyketide synthase [Paenibacillus riograndensis]CQR54167.1 hypothetical protein PRIO_1757 [Paenibacillus riograndensis SBR5]
MEKKDEIYSYILQEVGSGHLDKSIAAHLIQYLRQDQGKEADTDIAVIGVASRFSNTGSTSEVEQLLTLGVDSIQELPAGRKEQADLFLPLFQVEKDHAQYDKAGYLSEIDPFDFAFFNISPREASLMDPNQRLFLQLAWEAIEEAGYGGTQLTGSKTGVFIGYSSDFGEEYKKGIQMLVPEAMGVAIPGNIKSVIASRISHYLDLKGPAVVFDTACSSSLVAIHFACRQLIEGSCDLALAGGIKLQLFPLKSHVHLKIGIESSDEKTKTFDDSSNGTGKGEGAGAVLLKPLKKALQDRDHIHAVIKGSAINQDGNSIGITAPDPQAQEEVLCQAWEEAGINPENLSYIEAHGTGTRLGDPIEIEGIDRAFSRYTQKKQFCAIGSMKTNIGHLDHAAGIAGLVKVIYSLKSKKLFPSLHFMKPNQTINFSTSAVYVNDRLQEWTTPGVPRLAGISSFGLSGTNCHMVLEEAPPPPQKQQHGETMYLLPLSAKEENVLRELAAAYIRLLEGSSQIDLEDLCYTASTGRRHYNHRLAIVFTGYQDLLNQLERLTEKQALTPTLQSAQQLKGMEHSEKENSYRAIAELYVSGGTIDWEDMYKGKACNRLSLPVYPFQKTRCWLKPEAQAEPKRSASGGNVHPLLAHVAGETPEQVTYAVRMSAKEDWMLNEHKVGSEYVLPGTAYVELLLEIGRQQGGRSVIKDLAFLQPFSVQEGETRELQITLKKGNGDNGFIITSKDYADGTWRRHAEGKLCLPSQARKPYDLPALLEAFHTYPKITGVETSGDYITTGARWNNIKELKAGAEECLVAVGLGDAFREEAAHYHYHPAMLDNAVNIAIRSIDDQLYLPFYYQEIRVYGRIPADIYSVVRRQDRGQGNQTATFDIDILNPAGEVLAEIEGYTIKQVQAQRPAGMYYEKDWMVQEGPPSPDVDRETSRETVAVFTGEGELADRLLEQIRAQYGQVMEISGRELQSREDYQPLWDQLKAGNVETIIHLLSLTGREIATEAELHEAGERGFYSLYSLLDSLFVQPSSGDLKLVLVCDEANQVTGEEAVLRPHHGCLLGLGKVAREEFPRVHIRLVDVDGRTPPERIVNEFSRREAPYQVAYRNGQRYVERLREASLAPDEAHPGIQEGGVYVITGGTGGLGLEIGKQMSRMNRVKLHLIGRRELPARENWSEIVAAGAEAQHIRQITAVQEMERNGAEVQIHAADVAEEGQMRSLLERIRTRSGAIRGVVHAAGVAGEGLLVRKSAGQIREVLSAKVTGTWVLDQLTKEDELDFFMMFSSMNTVTGGIGQSDYVAANSYLDLYADWMRKQGRKGITVNWPLWQEVGMAQAYEVDNRRSVFESLTPRQGAAIYAELLQCGRSRMIVGQLKRQLNRDTIGQGLMNDYVLSDTLASAFRTRMEHRQEETERQVSDPFPVRILDKDEADLSATEREVAMIWGQVLGVDEIGLSAKFNNMGGNSILAVDLFRRLETKYGKIVNISDVFTYATIAEMADYLDTRQQQQNGTYTAEPSTLALLQRLANREISMNEALETYKTKSGGVS